MTKKDELYERLLEEKDRTITVLTDYVEYMRSHGAIPQMKSAVLPTDLTTTFDMVGDRQAWVSEEEMDIKELLGEGKLTKDEADAALVEILGDNL